MNNPLDIRNATFESIVEAQPALRRRVLDAWRAHGPCTTRELAARIGLDILTVRPRTTELVQLGLVECTGSQRDGGIYRAREPRQVREWLAQRRAQLESSQLQLL